MLSPFFSTGIKNTGVKIGVYCFTAEFYTAYCMHTFLPKFFISLQKEDPVSHGIFICSFACWQPLINWMGGAQGLAWCPLYPFPVSWHQLSKVSHSVFLNKTSKSLFHRRLGSFCLLSSSFSHLGFIRSTNCLVSSVAVNRWPWIILTGWQDPMGWESTYAME